MAKTEKKSALAPAPREATFASLIGHERAIEYFRRAHRAGRLPQAILFDGPPGVGKSAMAYALAKFLLADGRESGPEFDHHARKAAANPMIHPDLRVLAPSGTAGQIKVELARDAIDAAYTMPIESARKVFIIDPADRLNASSANSLLKLIEEPPKSVSIVLATESIHAILPTIRSRASRFRLMAVSEAKVAEWLVSRFAAEEAEARAAAAFCGGSPGHALELLGGHAREARDRLAEEWRFFQKHGFLSLFRVSSNLANLGFSTESLIAAWIVWVRDALLLACSPGREDMLVNRDRAADLAAEAERFGPEKIGRCLECLLEARADARRMIAPQLFVENLLLRLGPVLRQTGQ